MNYPALAAVAALGIALSGCASIVKGSHQSVAIATPPVTVALAPETAPEPFAEDPEPTEPFRLGAVADEPEDPPPPEEHGHTVELEALPGGSEEQPQRERD